MWTWLKERYRLWDYMKRIEAVTAKRCPREVKMLEKDKVAHPWRVLQAAITPYSYDFTLEVPIGYAFKDLEENIDRIFAAVGAHVEMEDCAGRVIVSIYPEDFPEIIEWEDDMF